MTQIATWDASQLAMSLGNIQIDSGFGADSMAEVTADQKDWELHTGQDGSMTRYKILASSAHVKITLGQSSIVNDVLSAARILDKSTPGGAGLSAFQLKDVNGTTLVTAAHAYIEGPPNGDLAVEVKEREWTIVLMDAIIFWGGNKPQ